MKNSPTLCQKFCDAALVSTRNKFPSGYIIHYMDDILLAHADYLILQKILNFMITSLQDWGLKIAPDKIQTQAPFSYLGRLIYSNNITSQKIQIRVDSLCTLNDFQKLLGDINWIRPYLKLTTADLKPLFEILQGD